MKRTLKWFIAAVPALLIAQSLQAAQITFYEREGFRGRAFTTTGRVGDFTRYGFNDRASSVVVDSGNWEVCDDLHYRGHCVLLRRGSYDSLRSLGLNDRVISVRLADRRRSDYVAPPPAAAHYEYRRRPHERIYEVPVSSARAVYGPPQQRCWIESQQVEERGRANVGGAVAGAIIGGVLGHQIGSGSGRDIATAGGAVVGGAIGANAGRDRGTTYQRDVEHCSARESGPPEYWDVRYEFRGQYHTVQMSEPPGRTILVNRDGEPRQ